MLIASTATVGLVLVGVLVLSMTPDRLGAPDESLIDSTDIVVAPNLASGNGSTNGGPASVVDNILRAVSTLRNATTTSPQNVIDPTEPVDPTAAPTSPASPATVAATSDPSVALVPVESTESPPPSNTAVEQPGTEPVVSSFDSALSIQSESALNGSQSGEPVPLGPTDSTNPLALIPGSSTSSTTSTVPGQSTTSSSTTTSTSTTTTAPATTTTLASQAKQLG